MNLADNLEKIQQRIRGACDRADREPNSVTLLAVSKTHPPETVKAAADCGQIYFGENKVQEAKAKIPLSRVICTGISSAICSRTNAGKRSNFSE